MSETKTAPAAAPAPGTFCWADLGTTNAEGAKQFYSELFDWVVFETGAGGTPYSMFQVDGRDVGAVYELSEEQRSQGAPPHWLPYVAVESAAESAARAAALGGKLIMDAFDVEQHGRMAIIEDPTGAVFAVWQPLEHKGAAHINAERGMCWNELATHDHERAREFYTGLFDWGTQTMDVDKTVYTTFTRGDGAPVAGLLQMTEEWGQAPAHWMTYFSVADCDAAATRAAELGGNICVPPTDIAPVGRFAVITDPQGATFSIIKLWS